MKEGGRRVLRNRLSVGKEEVRAFYWVWILQRAGFSLALLPDLPRFLLLQILQSVLGKQYRHVITLVVKQPLLLLCDMDRARSALMGLRALLGVAEGFAYAMVRMPVRVAKGRIGIVFTSFFF